MTPDEYLAALRVLHWTPSDLAHHLGWPVDRVRNWHRPRYRVPPNVAAWLARRAAAHQAMLQDDPPPTDSVQSTPTPTAPH